MSQEKTKDPFVKYGPIHSPQDGNGVFINGRNISVITLNELKTLFKEVMGHSLELDKKTGEYSPYLLGAEEAIKREIKIREREATSA